MENKFVIATDIVWRERRSRCGKVNRRNGGGDGTVLHLVPYQCPHPGGDVAVKFCEMLPLEETG